MKEDELVAGRRNVLEAIRSGKAQKLVIMKNARGKAKDILSQAKSRGVPVKKVSPEEFSALTGHFSSPQGVAVVVSPYRYLAWEDFVEQKKESAEKAELVLLLDHFQDPHNLGALIRTAEAAGIKNIIIPKDRSVQVNATVRKVAAGATEWVAVTRVTNLVNTLNELKNIGFWIYGAFEEGAVPYYQADWECRVGLVLGAEGKGLSPLVKDNCDQMVYIPMKGHISSLNVSVSGALFMFEFIRRIKGWQ